MTAAVLVGMAALACTPRPARRGPVDAPVTDQTSQDGIPLPGEYGPPDTAMEARGVGELRYRVASVDHSTGRVALVPAGADLPEREPQAGVELVLTMDEVRRLARMREPHARDVVSTLHPGMHLIVVPVGTMVPLSAADIAVLRVDPDEPPLPR